MTRGMSILHTRASVLAAGFPELLSPFEHDLVKAIAERRAAFGDEARISDAEQLALVDLVHSLEQGIRRLVADGRLNGLALQVLGETA